MSKAKKLDNGSLVFLFVKHLARSKNPCCKVQ